MIFSSKLYSRIGFLYIQLSQSTYHLNKDMSILFHKFGWNYQAHTFLQAQPQDQFLARTYHPQRAHQHHDQQYK